MAVWRTRLLGIVLAVADELGAWRLHRFGIFQTTAAACYNQAIDFDGVVIAPDGTFTVTTPEGYAYSFERDR